MANYTKQELRKVAMSRHLAARMSDRAAALKCECGALAEIEVNVWSGARFFCLAHIEAAERVLASKRPALVQQRQPSGPG